VNEWGLWRWRRPNTMPIGLTRTKASWSTSSRSSPEGDRPEVCQDGTGIDATITCSQDHWDGRTISNCNVMSYVGSHHSDEDKIAEDSLTAVYAAFARVLSGHQDVVLVATHCKESRLTSGVLRIQPWTQYSSGSWGSIS